jgi:phospho-N-acetylmuramoyl-pentapeptide-transferase
MFYHLLYPLHEFYSAFNIFKYISFRATGAAVTALLISFIIGPKIIQLLNKRQIGEVIRTDGPQSHHVKSGTPTMGGIILLAATIIPTILWAGFNKYTILVLISTMWMGFIGFVDDYLKVIKKMPDGLIAKYKLIGQVILGLIIAVTLLTTHAPNDVQIISDEDEICSVCDQPVASTNRERVPIDAISIPFVANGYFQIGNILYALLIIFIITGTSNAVNLTDGLDGLATGLVAISTLSFGVIAYVSGNFKFSDYLNIFYIQDVGELTIFTFAMVGACIGFLWYNAYPAKVFMGDTGSLSMGAALGTLAILLKKEILLVLIGGIFVAESISVILQVGYFKYTKRKYGKGKKLFKMAPIHHHYELKEWHESHVVIRFWIIGILLALLSLTTFKVQ